jgi:hypothetical protein
MFIIPYPTTLFLVWIFIPFCHSQIESLFDLDADLYDEASIEWMIAPHELGAEESYSLEQMIEPDASEFLAQNMDCGNDVDILRSFWEKITMSKSFSRSPDGTSRRTNANTQLIQLG